MRRVVGPVLAVLLVSACAVQGSASPVAAPTSPEAPPSAVVELPPRPREVRLDGVDPCSLLTDEQRAELGLDGRPVFSQAPVGLYPGADVPACDIRGFEPRAVTVGVGLVTSAGIEWFTTGELAAELRPVIVQGVMDAADGPYAAMVALEAELLRIRDSLQVLEDHYRRTEGENAALWGRV